MIRELPPVPAVAVCLAAEHLGASGILADAAAGLTTTFATARYETQAVTRVRGQAFSQFTEFRLNGAVFALLDAQLPHILAAAPNTAAQAGPHRVWMPLVYLLGPMLALLLIRFGWSWLSLQPTLFQAHRPDRPRHARGPSAHRCAWLQQSSASAHLVRSPWPVCCRCHRPTAAPLPQRSTWQSFR